MHDVTAPNETIQAFSALKSDFFLNSNSTLCWSRFQFFRAKKYNYSRFIDFHGESLTNFLMSKIKSRKSFCLRAGKVTSW